jgi:hypothetical protein
MTAARPAALALALSALSGCGAPEGVVAEPRTLVFSPARTNLELRLVNHGAAAVPLSRIRFDAREGDWGAFTIEDRRNPQEIAAGDAVSLHLRADRDRFLRKDGSERAGRARLQFLVGGAPQTVDVRYEPADPASRWRSALVRLAILAALAGLAWALTRRERRLAWPTWLPALAALAVLPLGPGLCPDAAGQILSAADLGQCADHRGGSPFAVVAAAEGWLVWLVALVAAALGRLAASDGHTAGARRLASRDLALVAAFAGPLLSFGTLDPTSLVLAQADPLVGALPWLPRWGLLVQPLAAAVAISAAAAPAGRVERIGLAAALVACFFGGFTPLAPFAGLSHAAALAAGVAVLSIKIAAVVWLVQRLQAAPAGSRARTWLVGLERVALPLSLANLLATAVWQLWR